jgi:hypothetical protein
MRKAFKILAALTVLACASVAVYIAITPKAVLINEGSQGYDEFDIELPGSRVSFGPIAPDSVQTIYFSAQDRSGPIEYSLQSGDKKIGGGTLQYDANGQYFRSVTFTIHRDGTVSGAVSG